MNFSDGFNANDRDENQITVVNRWDEKAGLRPDAVRSQVIDVLEALAEYRAFALLQTTE